LPEAHIRLNKLMAQRGLCSRREADRAMQVGRVRVDGKVVREPGRQVADDVTIELLPEGPVALPPALLVHKPRGVACDARGLRTVLHPLPPGFDEYAVAGRLDRDSRGLVVLARDGRIARALTGDHGLAKRYRVWTEPAATTHLAQRLAGLHELDGQPLRPMQAQLRDSALEMVLHEGRKHQIRRACARFGVRVVDLCRIAIGPWQLQGLALGDWRTVDSDINALVQAAQRRQAEKP